jgi:uncharacterized protein (DUF4415 family)
MRFTFDPAKNEKNIAERGLSSALAAELRTPRSFWRIPATAAVNFACVFWLSCMAACTPSLSPRERMNFVLSASGKLTGKRKNCMSNTRKPSPSRPDADNPEWTRKDMAQARPAAIRKVNQTIRLDPDVLAACQQEGRGWQTRINTVLREHMPGHQK